jgi:hypothetical protein
LQGIDVAGLFSATKTTERPVCMVVPDARYAGMFRVRKPDGTLTDMVNLTRANDAAAIIARDLMRDSMRQGNWVDDRPPKVFHRATLITFSSPNRL